MMGDNIRNAREAKGLSINALAKKCNISPGYLSDIEKGKKDNPSIDLLRSIAEVLETTIGKLVTGDDDLTEAVNDFYDRSDDSKGSDNFAKESQANYGKDADLYRIERARNKMSPKDKKKMMKILEASFEDYFDED